jgi:hypothetical protein
MTKRKRRPDLFMIQINLSFLHDCVYHMKWKRCEYAPGGKYWDPSRNIDYDPKGKRRWEVTQLVFKTRKEAMTALKGARMVRDFMKEFLKGA